MPGWTTTNWTFADWALLVNINDFRRVYHERRIVIGAGGISDYNVGDDVQDHELWKGYQDWIATKCSLFVRSYNADGSKRANDYYDGAATIEMWAFSDLIAIVNGGTDFRRYPNNPGTFVYGRKVAGDIYTQETFEDLQKAFNLLIWTKKNHTWINTSHKHGYGNKNPPEDWADAKTMCEADWHQHVVSTGPTAHTEGEYATVEPYVWEAYAWRSICDGYLSGLPTAYDCGVEWYFMGTVYDDGFHGHHPGPLVFDAHGDDVLEDLHSHWDAQIHAAGATETSSISFGQTIFPTWCADPTRVPPNNHGTESLGYESAASVAVLRWEEGFTYY